MSVEVKVPEVGESITEGILAEWVAEDGAVVGADDPLFVLETDKVTMTINAETGGRLKIQVAEGETVEVGQTVATLDESAAGEAAEPAETEPEPEPEPESESESEPESEPEAEAGSEPPATAGDERGAGRAAAVEAASQGVPQTPGPPVTKPAGVPQAREKLEGDHPLAPAVRRMVAEHGLDPERIEGTGRDGRITKEDVQRHLAEQEDAPARETKPAPAPTRAPAPAPSRGAAAPAAPAQRGERQTRKPMSQLRHRLAERLVQVQQNAAILTTFNEADMSRVMALRGQYKETFKEKHGVGLGFMSFFVKAAVDALKAVPAVNAFIEGGEIVTNHYYDIGVAVSTEHGLVVPVVRDADRLSLAGIEAAIAELAEKAKKRTLTLSDLTGGVFTISNGGIFGSMLSTPILNPPQSAILGMHAIQKRPVVVDDEIVVRPMMYLAVSYDHRLIDGAEAVTFLKRIKECLEAPERLMLEV